MDAETLEAIKYVADWVGCLLVIYIFYKYVFKAFL